MKSIIKRTFFFLGVTVLFVLSGCSSEESNFGSSYNLWRAGEEARNAYPKMSPEDAQKQYALDRFRGELLKMKKPKDRDLFLSYFYLGYAQINSRAVFEYCKKLGKDVSPFVEKFRSMNLAQENAVDRILSAQGLSQEAIWQERKKKLMKEVKFRLLKLAGHNGTYSLCGKLREHPERYLQGMSFQSLLPDAARELK